MNSSNHDFFLLIYLLDNKDKMHKKAAIELSINFIVVIIISIVIIGMGFVLFFSLKSKAVAYVNDLDNQQQDQLKSFMLSETRNVGVFPQNFQLSKGDSKLIGLGMVNNGDEKQNFYIKTNVDYTSDSETLQGSSGEIEVIFNNISAYGISQGVNPKDLSSKGLLIKMAKTARTGEYIITLNIYNASGTVANVGSLPPYSTVKVYIYNK